MKRMTYGTLPTRAAFKAAYKRVVGRDTYTIGNTYVGRRRSIDGEYTEAELWNLVRKLTFEGNRGAEESGYVASAILSTLGFEWV